MNSLFAVIFMINLTVPITGNVENTLLNNVIVNQIEIPNADVVGRHGDIVPAEAKMMLETNKNITLVDVRTDAEYENEHITGSMNIPLVALETQISTIVPDKNSIIIVYCAGGSRSKIAVKALSDMGYKNVLEQITES